MSSVGAANILAGSAANAAIAFPSPLLQQSQMWLVEVRGELKDVMIVGEHLEVDRPTSLGRGLAMTTEAKLLAIPTSAEHPISETDPPASEQDRLQWGALWFETGSMLHVLGRRLLAEGFHRLSMEMLMRALFHFYGWDGNASERHAAAIRQDMDLIPPPYQADKPTRSPDIPLERWSLEEALRSYLKLFQPPEEGIGERNGERSRQTPLPVLDSSKIPTVELKPGPFETEWLAMSVGQRRGVGEAMDRVYKIYNPSALTLLDTIVRLSRPRYASTLKIHDFLLRAIRALDVVLNSDPGIIIFKITIDGFVFPNVGQLKPDMLTEWECPHPLPDGIRVFY